MSGAAKRQKLDQAMLSRKIKDKVAVAIVYFGGGMVCIILLSLFCYLLYVVWPVFLSAKVTPVTQIPYENENGRIVMVGTDENNELIYQLTDSGEVNLFHIGDKKKLSALIPELPRGVKVIRVVLPSLNQRRYGVLLSNNTFLIIQIDFSVSYLNNKRHVSSKLSYPFDVKPISLSAKANSIQQLSFITSATKLTLMYLDDKGQWRFHRVEGQQQLLTDDIDWTESRHALLNLPNKLVNQLMIAPDQRTVFLLDKEKLHIFDIDSNEKIRLIQQINLISAASQVDKLTFLSDASSILVSYHNGSIYQYFKVIQDTSSAYHLAHKFYASGAILALNVEPFRKSFATINLDGFLSLYYATSEQKIFNEYFALGDVNKLAFSPRSNLIVADTGKDLFLFKVVNLHPEVSWESLWHKIWYEGYSQPQLVWQSTPGAQDVEVKLSLQPLLFGTLKAACYALLFAIPIAIAGAIYTAHFMSPEMRAWIKPVLELIEALPTVILGFLAGLWLAPLVENQLTSVLLVFICLPIGIFLLAFFWQCLPSQIKYYFPEKYRELLLIPFFILIIFACFSVDNMIENYLFDGDARLFITNQLGIDFNQRNALVVGLAMGFAVIPTIFSISEDAIFSVPKHLSYGSLALGATKWQTLISVVLLTASPGIFSAIMMGLSRAIGETMIVLMATGNTPIMDWNILQGMRTMAANIAVEIPESTVGSTQYRVLFLTALILFVFTFIFNTIAEIVRQRLRERYNTL